MLTPLHLISHGPGRRRQSVISKNEAMRNLQIAQIAHGPGCPLNGSQTYEKDKNFQMIHPGASFWGAVPLWTALGNMHRIKAKHAGTGTIAHSR